MPPEIRRAYFVRRIRGKAGPGELGRQFRGRVLSEQRFDDFCRMAVEASRSSSAGRRGVSDCVQWSKDQFKRALARDGGSLESAFDVLIAGLEDSNTDVRRIVVQICNRIGFASDLKPDKLLEALEKRWKVEQDDKLRFRTAFAFARYRTPEGARVIQEGLWSARQEIVSDSARLSGFFTSMVRKEYEEKSLRRLVELTHSANDKIRLGSVKALAEGATELLEPHLERLCSDEVDEVRSECAGAMRRLKNPEHLPLLIKLSHDEKDYVRSRAFSALGDPAFRAAIPIIAARLKDKDEMNRYEAMDAIVDIGGSEALEVLIREVEQGNTFGGDIFDRLSKLTGQRFKTAEEWLKWWRQSQAEIEILPDEQMVLPDHSISLQKLRQLGKALVIYANDDEAGRFPSILMQLQQRDYIEQKDLAWYLANIEYLGKGKTAAAPPDAVLAYDKTMLKKGEGTNVLFNDTHVAFTRPEQLEKLRIIITDKTGERGRRHLTSAAVHKQLDRVVDLSRLAPEMPFSDALEELKKSVKPPLSIVVLWSDLEQNADIDRTTPIDMEGVSAIRLGTALELLLKSVSAGVAELGYVVKNGVIVIATKESLPSTMETRVYDVAILVGRPAAFYMGAMGTGMYGRYGGLLGGGQYGGRYGGLPGGYEGIDPNRKGRPEAGEDAAKRAWDMVNLIIKRVEPHSWSAAGGEG
ncbi:MAG: HEAT repeat domain-containing protein, partial [Planctomycetota bacterium]